MLVDGFLGYRTSFMLDFVVCALILVVPLLVWSIVAARIRNEFGRHRRLQLLIGFVLLIAVTAFEVDLQLVHGGWQNIVAKQELSEAALDAKIADVRPWLWFHLLFAVTTPVFWIATIALALKKFSNPPTPGPHSRVHKTLGWLSAVDLTLTSVTGLIFYYVAFVR